MSVLIFPSAPEWIIRVPVEDTTPTRRSSSPGKLSFYYGLTLLVGFVAVIVVFAVLSLGSPVASMHHSFVNDDVPHIRLHETKSLDKGYEWVDRYARNESGFLSTSELLYRQIGAHSGVVTLSQVPEGHRYIYTDSSAETGVRVSRGLCLIICHLNAVW